MRTKTVDELIKDLLQLRLVETALLRQLEEARRLETGRATLPHPDLNLIVVGDRVKITNRVRNPKGGEVTKQDRFATVTRLHEGKVYFTTDNGTNTWRLPRNLQHLSK